MKKLLILLLILVSCIKDSSQSNEAESVANNSPIINVGATPTTPITDTTSTAETWSEQFMELINNHRTSIGLRPLIHNDEIGQIATTHSQNMADGSVAFGHTGFSSRCSEARSALGGGNWCGENVAAGQKTPQAAFTSWMNSSGHRANIEQTRATHTGFGYTKNTSGKYYWTQIFIEY